MNVTQKSIADTLSVNDTSGVVQLNLVANLEWSAENLYSLQSRLNACLAFIESGEVFVVCPVAAEMDIEIHLTSTFRPTEEALTFLRQAECILEEAGTVFRYGPPPSGYADDNAQTSISGNVPSAG